MINSQTQLEVLKTQNQQLETQEWFRCELHSSFKTSLYKISSLVELLHPGCSCKRWLCDCIWRWYSQQTRQLVLCYLQLHFLLPSITVMLKWPGGCRAAFERSNSAKRTICLLMTTFNVSLDLNSTVFHLSRRAWRWNSVSYKTRELGAMSIFLSCNQFDRVKAEKQALVARIEGLEKAAVLSATAKMDSL